jgi:5-(carboxyamino)imidazole ribonucleotide mutase
MNHKKVALVMGSISDWEVMKGAAEMLERFGVDYHREILSAHRTPARMLQFSSGAAQSGYSVIIAGAGGAAHLPGMIAAASVLPVIGVPVLSSNSIDGWDSVLSILQMPKGVPVATVALNGAANAGILAVQILALSDAALSQKLLSHKSEMEAAVRKMNEEF